jgi:putative oxidoreductase
MKKIFNTNETLAATTSRIMLGLVLFPHGAQKFLGWFGGFGFSETMSYFTGTLHLPWIISFLVIIIEFFGALFLIAGLGTRLVSASVIILFLGITATHVDNGFFMNWFGNQKGEGIEYFLLVFGLSASLLISGAGRLSLDLWVARSLSREIN